MITRRSFLAALSCLPFVGKLIPQNLLELNDANYRRVVDRQSGMSIRFVKKWDVVADTSPMRADGYMCEDGRIRFLVSRDGGQTWEQNGEPLPYTGFATRLRG